MNDEFYDTIASSYNELHGEEQKKKANIILTEILQKKRRGTLLDIGGGTGIATELFSKHFSCTVLDPSKELLALVPSHITKSIGTAEALPFEDHSFDVIISLTALHHADLKKSLQEMKRVAKEDACIGISFLKKSERYEEWRVLMKEYFPHLKEIEEEKDSIMVG